jgi:hypothetical protein
MDMRIILFTGAMLCYVISLINDPYMIIIKWELAQNKKGKELWISPKAMVKDYI